MSFGPESRNPRERRAYMHAVVAKSRQSLDWDDFDVAARALPQLGDSKKTVDSNFLDHLVGIERILNDRDRAIRNARYEQLFTEYAASPNPRINTDLMMISALRPERPEAAEVNRDVAVIHSYVKAFEKKVWFEGGLQRQVLDTNARGLSLEDGDLSALIYSLAGRTLITLRHPQEDAEITMITVDDSEEHRMGIQSVDATLPNAVKLIDAIMRLNRIGRMQFAPNQQIRII